MNRALKEDAYHLLQKLVRSPLLPECRYKAGITNEFKWTQYNLTERTFNELKMTSEYLQSQGSVEIQIKGERQFLITLTEEGLKKSKFTKWEYIQ